MTKDILSVCLCPFSCFPFFHFSPWVSCSIDPSRLLRLRALSYINLHLASPDVCKALAYLDENADVYLGYLGWGAGSFDETYVLSLAPTGPRQND